MIKEAYCSEEVSKLLKKKGFHESCAGLNRLMFKDGEKPVLRITHQKAMAWLREVHNIDVVIEISNPSTTTKKYYVVIWKNSNSYIIDLFDNYEEAVEDALKYCLTNLI